MTALAESDPELSIREIARELHRQASGRRPAFFEPRDWLRRMIDQSLGDASLRAALFRFVDVLPSLHSARDVGHHLEEYFSRVDHALGGLTLLAQTLHAGWMLAPLVRHNVTSLARRFIAEESGPALLAVLDELRAEPAAFTLDVVGEATVSEAEAHVMLERYERLLREVSALLASHPENAEIDRDPRGTLSRVHLSVKLSSLYARFDPLDPETERLTAERLRRLFREAARLGAAITVDMEHHQLKDTTLSIVRTILDEDEFHETPVAGLVLQAYLPETESDLRALLDWARARQRRIGLRLVKGAYWDSEIAWAKQKGWPVPVFVEKAATDSAFERLARLLLESTDVVDAAFGSHNLRSLASVLAAARALGLPPRAYEIQMLYGMAEPLRRALVERGERVRVYVPVGDLIPGMAYLIRRLLENTSNVSFLRQSYGEGQDLETLLAPPAPSLVRRTGTPPGSEFRNEPPLDFSVEKNRERIAAGLDTVQSQLGERYSLWLGQASDGVGELVSRNPARPAEVIGSVALADEQSVDEAVVLACEAFASWGREPVEKRVAVLLRAAATMRRRREELAAWLILEVGKGWRDADAEVCEAIDTLEYYGREIRRIGETRPTQTLPGEANELCYEPLGVTAVIAPWNFPLAIATGMTAAALVAGNTVVLKPAEQSPVIGARLHAILREAGLPAAACALVQGGGKVGAALVRHPEVRAIAFTGSRAVGLEILRVAAESPTSDHALKRVVCEMGGKNAIVVDEDADRDEAVLAIVESAFGYQGQKCSAASRLIIVGDAFEPVARRVAEAARTLRVGPPDDPRNALGPLIDEEAFQRVTEAIERGRREGRVAFERKVLKRPADAATLGYFVGPAIVADLAFDHPLAQEEIFGPVLCVFYARSFDEAIELANATPYGLTGGVFSRSPANLEIARREFRVGNLYLNRGITGAVVGRQPFGGLKLSGAGWKAGGPDYLQQFLESRVISENTLRHGFVPEL